MASDIIITDYSGCMFNGLDANKKVILYASDIEDFMADRGTYFSFDELPFPLAQNNNELEAMILNFDEKKYEDNARDFRE